jgi:glycerol-3-phosphate dehydrogenase subunit B
VRVINGSFVDTPVIADGRVRGVSVESSGSPRTIVGDAFVLATGGFESGALTLDSYGEVTERIFGLPLAGLDEGPLLHGDYWGGEQPLFKVGVAVDETMRVTAVGSSSVPSNLWAAGGILAGAVRWNEKSGEGIAAGSAVKAADAIVEELG